MSDPASDPRQAAAAPGPVIAPLPPIAHDDPRLAPHVEALQSRGIFTGDELAKRTAAIDVSRGKLADANASVEAAHAAVIAAQAKLDTALAARAAASTELNGLMGGVPTPFMTAAEALSPGEDTVLMFFPKALNLYGDKGRIGAYEPGIHPVPVSLQDHWWLRANDVRLYDGPVENKSKPIDKPAFNKGDGVRMTAGGNKGELGIVEVAPGPDGVVTVKLDSGQSIQSPQSDVARI